MMTVDHRHSYLESVRSVLSAVVYPMQYLVNLPIKAGRWMSESFATRQILLEENKRLREQHLLLSNKMQRFSVLEAENKRLHELLESSVRLGQRVLVAELVEVELEPFRQQIVINKGQRDGVYDGQPVVDASGIMGQVVHVGPFSSTVLLITDPDHDLPVQVNRNGLRAIAVGTGRDDYLLLQHLPTNSDIKKGDLIVSSGLGRRFPRGYPVGTVQSVSLEPGEPFANVEVRPSAKLSQSLEVLLVWPHEVPVGDAGKSSGGSAGKGGRK
jgi:rod shape-determining protein MreC